MTAASERETINHLEMDVALQAISRIGLDLRVG